ncbi:hypothetical protein [Piscirickettsia salmonis]|uniref:DinB/UmuC family translesion DNA polymerase n=1 Tax=Piscirickettsia salmonis TaxID=1238 RepID=UPI003CFC1731
MFFYEFNALIKVSSVLKKYTIRCSIGINFATKFLSKRRCAMKQHSPTMDELYRHCCTLLKQIEKKQQQEDYTEVRLLGLALDAIAEEMDEKSSEYH